MPWGLDRRTLEAGRDEKAALVAEDPWHHPLEELARAHLAQARRDRDPDAAARARDAWRG
jgi:hypothetical protein